jgi:drug/metabolite transporter (DMT)-like permease
LIVSTLYFLEVPRQGKTVWRYLLPPMFWAILGSVVALLTSTAYIQLSGNPTHQFASSFRSALIWERLLPNETYQPGLLAAILISCLPVVFIFVIHLWRRRERLDRWRILGLGSILVLLFAGGVVVSTKIGGGSNLHNFDAFMIVLLICGGASWFHQVALENEWTGSNLEAPSAGIYPVKTAAFLALLAPVGFAVLSGGPIYIPPPTMVTEALDSIQKASDRVSAAGGRVLFITERQLLTFKTIQGVDLEPEYEKVFLMEMVMSKDQPYLKKFREDISRQKYGLIISTQVILTRREDSGRYGDENREWRKLVNRPLWCYYHPELTYRHLHVQLLVPREKIPAECVQK